MMLTNVFLPFFLTVDIHISSQVQLDTVYSYNVSKVIIIYKEPYELTQLTSTITCQPIGLRALSCFMDDITSETTVKYSSQGIGKVKTDILKVKVSFQMWFNNRGLFTTYIPSVEWKIKNFIKHISQQFNLGINIANYKGKLQTGILFITDERTSIGNCKTEYNIDIAYVKHACEEMKPIFEIKPLAVLTYHAHRENVVRTHVMKYRTKCDYSTISDNENMNQTMTVANYGHQMKAEANKFKIITTIDVYLPTDLKPYPDPQTPRFSETTEINLFDIALYYNSG